MLCSDVNIIDASDFITKLILHRDVYDSIEFEVDGQTFTQVYTLVDGIYPPYACFMGTVSNPEGPAWTWFAKRQEGARKEVECAFGLLVGKWRIIKNKSRMWYSEDMLTVMKVCNLIYSLPMLLRIV